jgi:hypothetical protein
MQYIVKSGDFTGTISAFTARKAAKTAILQCVNTEILLGETITVEIKDTPLYFKTMSLVADLEKEGHDISTTDFEIIGDDD